MKRIVKEEMVKKTTEVFEAIDGNVFSDEQKCKEYENSLECTISAAWNKIPKGSISEEDMCWNGSCDSEFYIIIPRSFEDVKIINMYTKFTGSDLLTQDDIGKEIILEACCGDWYRVKSFDKIRERFESGIKSMKKAIAEYGLYEITVSAIGFNHKCYSYDLCIRLAKDKLRRKMQNDKLSTMEVQVVITKDDEAFENDTYQASYNSEIGYNSFKMEKGE